MEEELAVITTAHIGTGELIMSYCHKQISNLLHMKNFFYIDMYSCI